MKSGVKSGVRLELIYFFTVARHGAWWWCEKGGWLRSWRGASPLFRQACGFRSCESLISLRGVAFCSVRTRYEYVLVNLFELFYHLLYREFFCDEFLACTAKLFSLFFVFD